MRKSKSNSAKATVYNSKPKHGLAILAIVVVVMAVILGLAYRLRGNVLTGNSPKSEKIAQKPAAASGPTDSKQFIAEFVQAFKDGNKEKVNEYISKNTNDEKAFEGKDNYFDYCMASTFCSRVLKNTKYKASDQIAESTFSDATGATGVQLKHTAAAASGNETIIFYVVPDGTTWRFYRFDFSSSN